MNKTITAPIGFLAAGVHAGIKKQKKDMAAVVSKNPAVLAGLFTNNIVKAAPVLYDQKILAAGGTVRGVVINSGNANACTGEQGIADAHEMATLFAERIGCQPNEILVGSTGVIGVTLPMDCVRKGVAMLSDSLKDGVQAGRAAARGIMTTDTFEKTAMAQCKIGGKTVTIAGMAKGSGMIHPNMATMLAYITTDAAITQSHLQFALELCVNESFNMISVDGDTSTNDTILALANGMAGNPLIDSDEMVLGGFYEAFCDVCTELAKAIARDGEGATKLIEVYVTGAELENDAKLIARSVASSNLCKAALGGADANWGRVLCAMGYSGGAFDPATVNIRFSSARGSIAMMENGRPIVFDEAIAKKILSENDIKVEIELGPIGFYATAWGCDLTCDYVKINGDYRS
jgi:glutamate N-acetyltransferase/amino-acid N-acetyltransferase